MLCSECGKEIEDLDYYLYDDDDDYNYEENALCEDCHDEKMNLILNFLGMF